MPLIVGLGNPGNQYNFTRHNFGFLTLDFYAKIHDLAWEPQPRFSAAWFKFNPESSNGPVFFVKPQDFYNESGRAVQSFAHYYKIPPSQIYVVCDDFTLTFGQLRHRDKGSAGGNNGLKSCIRELGTDQFPRLRLGTANDALRQKLGDTDFVLSKFTPDEKSALPDILRAACGRIDDFLI